MPTSWPPSISSSCGEGFVQIILWSSNRLYGKWQIQITVEWAADYMRAPCIARCREEAALDEAVMPADAFAQKQAMMHRLQEQQEAFKVHIIFIVQRYNAVIPVLGRSPTSMI
jgi:hypothetical protein